MMIQARRTKRGSCSGWGWDEEGLTVTIGKEVKPWGRGKRDIRDKLLEN